MNPDSPQQPQPSSPDAPYAVTPKKQNYVFIIFFTGFFLLTVVVLGFMYIRFLSDSTPDQIKHALAYLSPTPVPAVIKPEDDRLIKYSNIEYAVTFSYPQSWNVHKAYMNHPELIAFAIEEPFYLFLERMPVSKLYPESVGETTSIQGVEWSQPNLEKPANKSGVFCELYNCDEQTYGKYYTIKNGYKYSFYYPKDIERTMQKMLSTFAFTQ